MWNKDRHIDKWNRIEFKNTPTDIESIDFLKKSQGNSVERGRSFQEMELDQLDIFMGKNKLQPFPCIISKITLTWIIDLNTKIKTLKLPEKNVEEIFCNCRIGKDCLR